MTKGWFWVSWVEHECAARGRVGALRGGVQKVEWLSHIIPEFWIVLTLKLASQLKGNVH